MKKSGESLMKKPGESLKELRALQKSLKRNKPVTEMLNGFYELPRELHESITTSILNKLKHVTTKNLESFLSKIAETATKELQERANNHRVTPGLYLKSKKYMTASDRSQLFLDACDILRKRNKRDNNSSS
jgi:hypothetical protein